LAKNRAERIERTVQWLRAKAAEAGVKGLVVGLSGGLDSAVCACLIKKAFPDDSLAVLMPCHSHPGDGEDARKLIAACGIRAVEVDITALHAELMAAALTALGADTPTRMADANLRARLRMSTLYFIANLHNYLVVGTDNAAELYTGYFTKYGDGGVDLLPLARLKKYEVREWAEHLGVPPEIISKPPSAGLWQGQTDEAEMGTSYAMIDALLDGEVIPERDRTIIERLHRISAHKRSMPPQPPEEE
jgi:NAD+ synthase